MEKNEIYILRQAGLPEETENPDAWNPEIERRTGELLKRAQLSSLILRKCGSYEAKILLKPNLLGPIPASQGATTHREVVSGLIRYLRDQGFQDLLVAEGSWVGDRTEDALLVTGYSEMLRDLDVPFLDLQRDPARTVDAAGMDLSICSAALDADFLINVPVLKGHCQTRMTCALKNMKGCLPGSEKRRFHRCGLHAPIAHLARGLRQDFIVVDALSGDLTSEDGGRPVRQDLLLCGLDPVLIDAWACRYLGIPQKKVPYISMAGEIGAGCADAEKARVSVLFRDTWISPASLRDLPVSPSPDVSLVRIQENVQDVDCCSACYAALLPALRSLEEERHCRFESPIAIGQGYRGRTGKIGIGTCTRLFEHSLPGCPPEKEEICAFLRKL